MKPLKTALRLPASPHETRAGSRFGLVVRLLKYAALVAGAGLFVYGTIAGGRSGDWLELSGVGALFVLVSALEAVKRLVQRTASWRDLLNFVAVCLFAAIIAWFVVFGLPKGTSDWVTLAISVAFALVWYALSLYRQYRKTL